MCVFCREGACCLNLFFLVASLLINQGEHTQDDASREITITGMPDKVVHLLGHSFPSLFATQGLKCTVACGGLLDLNSRFCKPGTFYSNRVQSAMIISYKLARISTNLLLMARVC